MPEQSDNKPWSFSEQLQVGSRGEEIFMANYPKKIKVYPDRDGDFIEVNSKRKIELKTDTYNIEKTPNFFIERYSVYYPDNLEACKPGGPWQAQGHGCDIFCYMFVRHNIWFQFNNLPALVDRLNNLTEKMGIIYIKNHGYITTGYRVPRDSLKDLYTIWEF